MRSESGLHAGQEDDERPVGHQTANLSAEQKVHSYAEQPNAGSENSPHE